MTRGEMPMASKDNHEERDLELMFAEARRYDLLTAEQEREIDGRKWRAVQALQQLFVEEKELLDYCTRFIAQCSSSPPEIKRFTNRDQHFVLRRELAPLLRRRGARHDSQGVHTEGLQAKDRESALGTTPGVVPPGKPDCRHGCRDAAESRRPVF